MVNVGSSVECGMRGRDERNRFRGCRQKYMLFGTVHAINPDREGRRKHQV